MRTPAARSPFAARRARLKGRIMKTSKAIRFGPALLGLVLFAALRRRRILSARVPARRGGKPRRGDRTVRFAPQNGKAPTELALTSQTKFIHNWHFAPADELKDGTRAVVYYRTPFFGRPFVTKVVWVNGA
jgi:hypothetical protein